MSVRELQLLPARVPRLKEGLVKMRYLPKETNKNVAFFYLNRRTETKNKIVFHSEERPERVHLPVLLDFGTIPPTPRKVCVSVR